MKGCAGPLVWFTVDASEPRGWAEAGLLLCATCGYLIVTGTIHDDAHAATPLLVGA